MKNKNNYNFNEEALKVKFLEIAEFYGLPNQLYILAEETSELTQASLKYVRDLSKGRRDNLIEEMADVIIVLNQIRHLLRIRDDELHKVIEEKTERQLRRIEQEKEAIESKMRKFYGEHPREEGDRG